MKNLRFAAALVALLLMGQGFPAPDALGGAEVAGQLGGKVGQLGNDLNPGGAIPVFDTGDPETTTWGVPTTPPIAGMTLLFQALGSNVASGGTGTWTTSGSLATTLTGTNDATPVLPGASLVPDTDYFDPAGNRYAAASAPGVALGTYDLVTVAMVRVSNDSTDIYLSNHNGTGGSARYGFEAFSQSSGAFSCSAATASLADITDTNTSGLDEGTHALHVCILDRTSYMESYVNGTGTGSPVDISAGDGENLHNSTDPLTLAGRASGAASSIEQEEGLSFVQIWGCDGCLTTTSGGGDYDAEMDELYARVNGSYLDVGSAPSTGTRASQAYLRVCDPVDNAIRYEYVGDDWPRRELSCGYTWDDPTSSETTVASFLQEPALTNLVDFGNLLDNAAWTKINSATVDANQQNDPAGEATLDDIDGVAASGEHGVSQAQTLTAASYVLSAVYKPGNQTFAYMDVSSIANVSAYWDSSDCQPDTVGSAATAYGYDLGDLCYLYLVYTGTAASHTHRLLCAEADGDKDYAGAAGDCSYGWVGIAAAPKPHSPVLTTSATNVARSTDVGITYALTGPTTGTAIVDARAPPNTRRLLDISNGTTAERVNLVSSSAERLVALVRGTGGSAANGDITSTAGNWVYGTRYITRLTWAPDDLEMYIDGTTEGTDASVGDPTGMDELTIGSATFANQPANDSIYRVRVYDSVIAPGAQGTGDDVPVQPAILPAFSSGFSNGFMGVN